MSMEVFRYHARTQDGDVIAGVVRANSREEAALDLKRRALYATSITVRSPSAIKIGLAIRPRRSAHAFFRAFGTLVRAGIPIRRALVLAIENCADRVFREALRAVLADVEHGSSLSAALARRPREFSTLETAMVGAGEAGGVLEEVLERLTVLGDREHVLRKRLQSALVYPCIVASVAGGLIVFLLVHVVPMFASMFDRFGAPLPLPTRILLDAGRFAVSPWAFLMGGCAMLFVLGSIRILDRSLSGFLDRVRFSLPIAGAILRNAVVARVARMLGALLQAGVGILDAIDVVLPATGSQVYSQSLLEIGEALRRGETLHQVMVASRLFDSLTLALTAVGEESGCLDRMLLAAANYMDVEVEAALTGLAALIEPVLIGFLGAVVAAVVFAIFLPLYGLIGSIS
jgi:type IV pilus assembly protein PilC